MKIAKELYAGQITETSTLTFDNQIMCDKATSPVFYVIGKRVFIEGQKVTLAPTITKRKKIRQQFMLGTL